MIQSLVYLFCPIFGVVNGAVDSEVEDLPPLAVADVLTVALVAAGFFPIDDTDTGAVVADVMSFLSAVVSSVLPVPFVRAWFGPIDDDATGTVETVVKGLPTEDNATGAAVVVLLTPVVVNVLEVAFVIAGAAEDVITLFICVVVPVGDVFKTAGMVGLSTEEAFDLAKVLGLRIGTVPEDEVVGLVSLAKLLGL
jgi:hypothetical protein